MLDIVKELSLSIVVSKMDKFHSSHLFVNIVSLQDKNSCDVQFSVQIDLMGEAHCTLFHHQ